MAEEIARRLRAGGFALAFDECFAEQRLNDGERARLRLPASSLLVYAFPSSAKAD